MEHHLSDIEHDPGGVAGTIAVAGAEFGWGSTGKLSAVIAALRARSPRPLRFVGLASRLSRTLLAEHGIDRWYDVAVDDRKAVAEVVRQERIVAGLVVLEGPAAMALEGAEVPTVFVDSLPFLWTEGDRAALPMDVSVYCAQRCVDLPAECRGVLASIGNLRWVEAVVSAAPSASAPAPSEQVPMRRALVNLGGLRSPTLGDWTCYPRVVVPAVLSALAAFGVRDAHVAGNLPEAFRAELEAAAGPVGGAGAAGGADEAGTARGELRVTYGPLGHREFLDRLARADVLLTSPGLTTLLEAGALARPVVCLPPQNLSQIFNGRFHSSAVGADVRVRWPAEVFSEERVLDDRTTAEEAALRVIYGGIADAVRDTGRVRPAVRDGVLAALRRARDGADWRGLADTVGAAGAAQVADHVLALALRTPTAARS